MAGPRGLIVAIDGVIGAGKSTVARGVAAVLGYRHLDTGAMYRAVALSAGRRGIGPGDANRLQSLLDSMHLDLEPEEQGGRIRIDHQDVTEAIRSPDVSRVVGSYADVPAVRRALVQQQQAAGRLGGVVAEGRDMTSVVFPDADLKIFMIADLDERARRRHREFVDKGVDITVDQVRLDIEQRDREDAVRDYGGDDASDFVEVDTTGLDIDAVVARIISLAQQRGA
ncbi:MAG TPA: (d)CMP kinase [Candidatus Latescibacteria bacterium]|nr:cytidylate kinase [Gemmatimonadaceae bacterium]MDP6017713.1 (d)CMP kinase [Candidatus Latescibacterota bacterium]HJP31159.1 (d)CMP kinase [Candidatus Latescibacterota bacterium]